MFLRTDINNLRAIFINCSDSQWNLVRFINLKDPRSMLLISLCVGIYGVDRFMLERKISGVLKSLLCQLAIIAGVVSFFLLLCDKCSGWGIFCLILFLIGEIWWIVDICLVRTWTKEYNYELITHIINI